MEALIRIQKKLKAPKGQTNQFGNYKYRSCEDILEAVKPFLGEAFLTLSDEIVEIGTRVYVKATATLRQGDQSVSVTAWAREQDSRKGMDAAQVTGSASSYARKYAVSGLFLCDDGHDADSLPPQTDATGPADWTPTTGPAPQEPAPAAQPGGAQPAPAINAPPQGQTPAPNPDERKWLKMLWDFYVTQAQGKKMETAGMHKMMSLCYMHLGRYPSSMADVDLIKQPKNPAAAYIKVEELIG